MRIATSAALATLVLAVTPAVARDDAPGDRPTLAQNSSPRECASLAREEREARRRGDRWRADQFEDEYESECRNRGK
jgi:hypothetical protein